MSAKLILIFGLAAVVGTQQAAPPARPLVPAAANSIVADPKAFEGQIVTVFAAVDRVLSATSFTVDQDVAKTAGDLLVIAPVLTAPLTVNSYVTVIGEVAMVDGRAAIKATSVIDAKMVDLARRLPPPLTPEETAFDAVMKRVGPAFNALRQGVNETDAEALKTQTATLKSAFADTEAFFKTRGKADGQKWAAEARGHVEALEKSAGNWDAVKASVSALQQTCSSCHAVYRERQDDGSYRIRGENK